ncbi:MAG: hypothetical protein ACNYWU_11260, partial [Desulfobacterales bacterium]
KVFPAISRLNQFNYWHLQHLVRPRITKAFFITFLCVLAPLHEIFEKCKLANEGCLRMIYAISRAGLDRGKNKNRRQKAYRNNHPY